MSPYTRPSMPRALHVGLVVLSVLICAGALGAQSSRERYRQGLDAYGDGRWQAVVDAMQAAIADRDQARVGALARRYTPRFFLGVALAELGDCRGALEAWRVSTEQGQIQKTDDFAELEQRQSACDDRLRQVALAAERTREALASAETAGEAWREQADEPSYRRLLGAAGDPLRRQAEAAETELVDASRALDEAITEEDADRLGTAAALAEGAEAAFRRLGESLEQRLRDASEASSARERLTETAETARRLLRGLQDLMPFPPELGNRVADVEVRLEEVEALTGEIPAEQVSALDAQLAETIIAVRSSARRPPAPLVEAVEAYLQADHEGVFEALSDAERALRGRRAQEQACLLRAAAAFSAKVLAGADDTSLESARLDQAIIDCRSIGTPPKPDTTFFSPRFVAFFEAAMAAPEEDEAEGVAPDPPAERP